jgi:endonuclease/exonuclease/phosphatase family metal-dependent hydrolase
VKNNRHNLAPNELKVMSFNVREPADGGKDEWAVRAGAVMQMFDDQLPTLVGFQEASHEYINKYLHAVMPQHGYVFLDDPEPQNSVAYRPELLKLIKTSVMWLSDTPSIPSVSPSGYVRTARWMVFEIIATGTQFFYVNTHFDLSTTQQKQNLKLIRSLISQYNKENLPVVLTGDFNVESDTGVFESIQETMVCTRDVAPIADNEYTYNAWGNSDKFRIIDHIFISKELQCSEYKTVTQPYGGHTYVSDHYPVYSIINFDNHE